MLERLVTSSNAGEIEMLRPEGQSMVNCVSSISDARYARDLPSDVWKSNRQHTGMTSAGRHDLPEPPSGTSEDFQYDTGGNQFIKIDVPKEMES